MLRLGVVSCCVWEWSYAATGSGLVLRLGVVYGLTQFATIVCVLRCLQKWSRRLQLQHVLYAASESGLVSKCGAELYGG